MCLEYPLEIREPRRREYDDVEQRREGWLVEEDFAQRLLGRSPADEDVDGEVGVSRHERVEVHVAIEPFRGSFVEMAVSAVDGMRRCAWPPVLGSRAYRVTPRRLCGGAMPGYRL